MDLELAEQIEGIPKAWGPMPFKKTAATPSHGTPAESDDITGGIGYAGLAEIQRFVDDGGLLITLGNGSMLALEGGIVRGVRRESGGVPRSAAGGGSDAAGASQFAETRTPGSHLRVTFDQPEQPHRVRLPRAHACIPRELCDLRDAAALAAHGLLHYLSRRPVRSERRRHDLGRHRRAPLVVSGQAWGEEDLIGHPAIFDMPVGKGRVVAFNFNPSSPRHEPRRSEDAVERHPQLAGDPRRPLRPERIRDGPSEIGGVRRGRLDGARRDHAQQIDAAPVGAQDAEFQLAD